MQVYFTFKTFSDAGIGDQLGAQFAHLFALGSLCGWTYVHLSPIRFNRRNFGRRHFDVNDSSILHNVACHLGLNQVTKEPLVDKKISTNLSSLISNVHHISQANDKIQEILDTSGAYSSGRQECEYSVLLEILLDDNYHAFIPVIEALTEMSWSQVLQFSGAAFLQKKVSSTSLKTSKSQHFAVAHVRIGDSIRIDTPFCPIILHGKEVYTSLIGYRQAIGSVDPGRRPYFNPFDLSDGIDSLLHARSLKRDSLVIVSDGFKTTKECILAHMRSRRLSLRIAISALRSIYRLESMFFRTIKDIPPSRRIIGEDSDCTLKSIELFSNATFLMCNSGGFSNVIFHLYNPMAQSDKAFAWL